MRIALEEVLAGREVDGYVERLAGKLQQGTRRREVDLSGIGIREKIHVVNAGFQCESDDISTMHLKLRRLEVVSVGIGVHFDHHNLPRRCCRWSAAARSSSRRFGTLGSRGCIFLTAAGNGEDGGCDESNNHANVFH